MKIGEYDVTLGEGYFPFLLWFVCWTLALIFAVQGNYELAIILSLASQFLMVPAYVLPVVQVKKHGGVARKMEKKN